MNRLLVFISFVFFVLGQAHAGSVHIVLSEEGSSYQQAASDIQSALRHEGFTDDTQVSQLDDLSRHDIADDDLIISVGDAATQQASQRYPANHHIFSYIDKTKIPEHPPKHWHAVLLDQPLQRLVDTASEIIPQRIGKTLILVLSDDNNDLRDEIKQLQLTDQVELKVLHIDKDTEPAKVIDKDLFNAGALIATRDKRIWSGENAKWMLYQSYKYNVPVIGYSKSFLKAGALVSVYAELSETAHTVAELVINSLTTQGKNTQEGIHYPRYTVEYNKNIARALKIKVPKGEQADVRD